MNVDLELAEWQKSSYSGGNGGLCVEMARTFLSSGVVPVRDSKDPDGPSLVVGTEAWRSFVGFAAACEI
ncbi:DUF397 domain-containing protein [Kitasatospora sp. NBC_00374]|uniref:DUF397 domain-containing protein n=1 Tax=Kitasatospora sp. NBC_00374 TaxID=2975964 RepID=UPI0030DF43C8